VPATEDALERIAGLSARSALKESFDRAYDYYVAKVQQRFAMLLNFLEQIVLAGLLIIRGLAGSGRSLGSAPGHCMWAACNAYAYWFLLGARAPLGLRRGTPLILMNEPNASSIPSELAIVTPLAAAVIIACGLPKRFSVQARLRRVRRAAAHRAALSGGSYPAERAPPYAFLSTPTTRPRCNFGIGLKLGVNGISLPLFVLAALVGFAAGLYAIQSGAERLKIYLMLLLIMQGGLMGVFASVDIFFFYFFHELALIPTFIMVGVWGGRDRSYAAMKMTIYLTLGAMVSLLGLIMLYVKSGAHTFDLIAPRPPRRGHPLELRGCRTTSLRPPPLRSRRPRLALAAAHVGAARLRRRAQFRRDAARRRA
jgi:hypothetical protein